VTASLLEATVSPDPDIIPSATIGIPIARSYAITNPVRSVHRPCRGHIAGERTPRAVHDREPPAAEAPAAGRVLFGNVEARTSANILVGRGDVIVQSVS